MKHWTYYRNQNECASRSYIEATVENEFTFDKLGYGNCQMRWQKINIWELFVCNNQNESFLCINLHHNIYNLGGMQRRWTTQHHCSTTRFNIEQSTPISPTSQTHSEPVSMIPRCETISRHRIESLSQDGLPVRTLEQESGSTKPRYGFLDPYVNISGRPIVPRFLSWTRWSIIIIMILRYGRIFSAGWITGLTSHLSCGRTLPMSQRWNLCIMQLDVLKHFVLSPSVSTACRWPAFFGWVWTQFKIWWAHCKEFK